MLEKINQYTISFQKNHKTITAAITMILFIMIAAIFIPIAILYIIGSLFHKVFFTGLIYKKENNRPKLTWI
jgi:accessory gene regulator protein AgrB